MFNSFITQQAQEPGEALLTLVQFDHEYEFLHNSVPLSQVAEYKLKPRGTAALLVAIGRAIIETAQRLANLDEKDRRGLVVFVMMTDGQENSSTEFSNEQIKGMIEEQQTKYRWHVTFLGADQDAFDVATRWELPGLAQQTFPKARSRPHIWLPGKTWPDAQTGGGRKSCRQRVYGTRGKKHAVGLPILEASASLSSRHVFPEKLCR